MDNENQKKEKLGCFKRIVLYMLSIFILTVLLLGIKLDELSHVTLEHIIGSVVGTLTAILIIKLVQNLIRLKNL